MGIGFLSIIIISMILAHKIGTYFTAAKGSFAFLFVAVIAMYYLIDVVIHSPDPLSNVYFYFWCLCVITEVLLFLRKYFILIKKKVVS